MSNLLSYKEILELISKKEHLKNEAGIQMVKELIVARGDTANCFIINSNCSNQAKYVDEFRKKVGQTPSYISRNYIRPAQRKGLTNYEIYILKGKPRHNKRRNPNSTHS